MASQKKINQPLPSIIEDNISMLIEIASVESEEEAKFLFEQVIQSIYEENGLKTNNLLIPNIASSFALIRSIKPVDDKEKIYTALVILGQIIGMYKLSQRYKLDQKIALRFLKISNDALQHIYEKRGNQIMHK